MSSRQIVWGAGATVVLGTVAGATVNELHEGWPWWLAAAVVTAAGAALAARMASAGTPGRQRIGSGAVVAGRDIAGRVRTAASSPDHAADGLDDRLWTGPGAVVAGRDITRTGDVDTTGTPDKDGR